MSVEQRSENPSNGSLDDAERELMQGVIDYRTSGLHWAVLAALLRVTSGKARYYGRKAIRLGLTTPEAMRYRPTKRSRRFTSEAEYDAHTMERIKANVTVDDCGCWLWKGHKNPKGYGTFNYHLRTFNVHRVVYKITRGVELKEEEFVCHTCDVRHCCNPEHLWIGSTTDNIRDMIAKGRNFFINQTHCWRGHEFTPENTYVKPSTGARACKLCTLIRTRMKAGWTEEEAAACPLLKPGERTPRRTFKRRAA